MPPEFIICYGKKLSTFLYENVYGTIDAFFTQAQLISAASISAERLYAIYWLLKHSPQYRIAISMVWALSLLDSTINFLLTYFIWDELSFYAWIPHTLILVFIVPACDVSVWRKIQRRSAVHAPSHCNRALGNQRLTKTLLFVSMFAFLSWLPLIVSLVYMLFDGFSSLYWSLSYFCYFLYYSNSLINAVVYSLRIPEYREAMLLFCLRRQTAVEMKANKRDSKPFVVTPGTQLTTLSTTPSHLVNMALEVQVIMTLFIKDILYGCVQI